MLWCAYPACISPNVHAVSQSRWADRKGTVVPYDKLVCNNVYFPSKSPFSFKLWWLVCYCRLKTSPWHIHMLQACIATFLILEKGKSFADVGSFLFLCTSLFAIATLDSNFSASFINKPSLVLSHISWVFLKQLIESASLAHCSQVVQ